MIINNLDLRIFDFVNVFLVSHFYHEPPAREIGQPLPVYLTVNKLYLYLTVILRGRAGYELIYITNEAVGRVGYYQLISGKSEKNNCFSKFSSSPITGNCH